MLSKMSRVCVYISGMSIDSFVAIHWPFRYHSLITKKRAAIVCLCINTYTGIIAALPLLGWSRFEPEHHCILANIYYSFYVRVFGGGMIQITIFCITVIYGLIGRTAIKQKNKITAITFVEVIQKKGTSNKMSSWKSHTKAAKNLLIVIVVFTICTLPYSVTISVITTPKIPEKPRSSLSDTAELISLTLVLMNSAVNPLIYNIKFPKFRKAFKILLHINNEANEKNEKTI